MKSVRKLSLAAFVVSAMVHGALASVTFTKFGIINGVPIFNASATGTFKVERKYVGEDEWTSSTCRSLNGSLYYAFGKESERCFGDGIVTFRVSDDGGTSWTTFEYEMTRALSAVETGGQGGYSSDFQYKFAFDGNVVSYYVPPASGTWPDMGKYAYMDFGTSRRITRLKVVPRYNNYELVNGCCVDISDTSDFSTYTTIATLPATPTFAVYEVIPDVIAEGRYLRVTCGCRTAGFAIADLEAVADFEPVSASVRQISVVEIHRDSIGSVKSVSLGFPAGVKPFYLYMGCSETDQGENWSNWNDMRKVAKIPAGCTSYEYVFQDDFGQAERCVRFFLLDDVIVPFAKRPSYIEVNGTQRVAAACTVTNRTKMRMKYELLSLESSALFTCRPISLHPTYSLFYIKDSGWRFDHSSSGASGTKSGVQSQLGTTNVFLMDSAYATANGMLIGKSSTEPFSTENIIMFAARSQSGGGVQIFNSYSSGRFYGFEMWQDGYDENSKIMDLIPAVSNSVPCLYNKVDGTYLTGIGGDLVASPYEVDVEQPMAESFTEPLVGRFGTDRQMSIAFVNKDGNGNIASVDLSFTAGEDRWLYVGYGSCPGDPVQPSNWEYCEEVALIPGNQTEYTVNIPSGWKKQIGFFLLKHDVVPCEERYEYLTIGGSHYVKTDFKPGFSSTIEMKVALRDVGTSQTLLCARGNSTQMQTYTVFYIGNTGWRFDFDRKQTSSKVTAEQMTPCVVKTDNTGLYMDEARALSVSGSSFEAASMLVLFASHSSLSGYGNYFTGDFYSLRAWSGAPADSTLALDLYPCKMNGKVCFYDKKSKSYLNPNTEIPTSAGAPMANDYEVTTATVGYFESPLKVTEPTKIVGDCTWTIHQKETLCFDNALKEVAGTIRVTSDKVSKNDLGILEFRGTNVIDGAIVVTAAQVKVSGLLATPGHVDQGTPSNGGGTTLTIDAYAGGNTYSYLSVSNAVIEKPLFLRHYDWGAIVSSARSTNVFSGSVMMRDYTYSFDVADGSEIIFEGGIDSNVSMHHRNTGIVRIRNRPAIVAGGTGWSHQNGTLSLETTGNKFNYLSAGYDANSGAGIQPTIRFICDNAFDLSAGTALLNGFTSGSSGYVPFPDSTASRGHIYLGSTVQKVNRLVGSRCSVVHGDSGARIEIFNQTTYGSYLPASSLFFASELDGDVSLAMCGQGTFILTNRTFETTGSLTVTNGTVLIAQNAVWKGTGPVVVSGNGLLKTTAAQQFDIDSTILRLADNGKVDIPAGVILSVKVVEVFDGGEWVRLTDAAQYGGDATGLMAGRITGGGTLNVRGEDPEGVKSFPLEWNEHRVTGVPYEVEISTNKLASLGVSAANAGFRVYATVGEVLAQLDVVCMTGKVPDRVVLRFTPPAGTTALTCKVGYGTLSVVPSETIDNLFASALVSASGWTLGGSIVAEKTGDGIRLSSPVIERGKYASFEVAVPATWRGLPVRFEMSSVNESSIVWYGYIKLRQFDALGAELPESVVDPRWISHLRPVNVPAEYRENGRIHPDAVKIVLMVEISGTDAKFDDDGKAIVGADAEGCRPRLRITHLALRNAEELPFPKYADNSFVEGVSGEPGDRAIVLGNTRTNSFFFATRSQASWGDCLQLRREEQLFYPAGSGTVEAWIKPSAWNTSINTAFIFDAQNGDTYYGSNSGEHLTLSYKHSTGALSLLLKDYLGTKYTGNCVRKIPLGEWTHVAVQWTVGGSAELFINGENLLTIAIPDFNALDLAGLECPNDYGPVEFFFGCHAAAVRQRTVWYDHGYYPIFEGAADLLRISTGARYPSEGFTPQRSFVLDADTRALFDFNRSFDGVSGGGIGFISGTLRSVVDRVDHQLDVTNGGIQESVWYYAQEILPQVDPDKIFNHEHYTNLPTNDDFLKARKCESKTMVLAPGGSESFVLPEGVLSDYVEIRNDGDTTLVYPTVFNQGDLDLRSYCGIRDSLGLDDLEPEDRANGIFQLMIDSSDYYMIHTAMFDKGSDLVDGAENSSMLLLNSYCGFECGPLNNIAKTVFACAGDMPSSMTIGYGHAFEEVLFDGKNHMYDLSAQQFITAMDNETSASEMDLDEQPGALARQGRAPSFYVRKSTRYLTGADPDYNEKFAMSLNPRERFIMWFDNNGEQNDLVWNYRPSGVNYNEICGAKSSGGYSVWRLNRFFPQAANGFLVFDGRYDETNPAFVSADEHSFVYSVNTCYPIVSANYTATLWDGSVASVEISTDNGSHWRPMSEGLIRYPVRGRRAYLVKVLAAPAQVKRFHAMTEVQINARVLSGRARSGQNLYTLTAESGERAKVTIGYRLPAKQIVIRGGAYTGTIPGAERQLVVVDPTSPLALEVEGASADARVKTFGGLSATLANGVLTVSAGTLAKGFGAVDIIDGDAVKQLTVLVSPNARLVTAGGGLVGQGDATLLPAAEGRVQPCVNFTGTGSQASANFASLPAGKYAILNLCRFASHSASYQTAGISMTVGGDETTSCSCSRDINSACCYYKARYGTKGGRSNFKWDYPNDPATSYPTEMMRVFDIGTAFSQVDFTGTKDASEGVELAAVLVVPVDKAIEEEFYCDIIKVLCGLNCQPWRVAEKPIRTRRLGTVLVVQ